MAGSIRKRGHHYSIRYDGPPRPDGKRNRKEEAVKGTKKDAERLLRQRIAEVESGLYVQRNQHLTVRQYLEEWLETYGRSNLKHRTLVGYRQKLRYHAFGTIGPTKLADLLPEQVEAVYAGMMGRGLSASTVRQLHRILNRAFVIAVRSRRLARNPLDMVTPPRPVMEPQVMWTVEQIRDFLTAVETHRYREFYELALYSGLRRSELAGLTWDNVDLGAGALQVTSTRVHIDGEGAVVSSPKTRKSRRRISIGPEAVAVLHRVKDRQQEWRAQAGEMWAGSGYVFTMPDGSPVDPTIFTRAFAKVVEETRLPKLSLKDLRHAHATLLLLENVHLKVVSERLGHSSVTVTGDIYSHVLPEVDRAASLAVGRRLGLS